MSSVATAAETTMSVLRRRLGGCGEPLPGPPGPPGVAGVLGRLGPKPAEGEAAAAWPGDGAGPNEVTAGGPKACGGVCGSPSAPGRGGVACGG
ncbi:hypothetical protein SANTM175S_08669 [Streptomyces antimycoticus]